MQKGGLRSLPDALFLLGVTPPIFLTRPCPFVRSAVSLLANRFESCSLVTQEVVGIFQGFAAGLASRRATAQACGAHAQRDPGLAQRPAVATLKLLIIAAVNPCFVSDI